MADDSTFNKSPTPSAEPVQRQVDERVRQLALDLVGSIDLDDDDWRVAPLPNFGGPARSVKEDVEVGEPDPNDRHP